MISVAEARLRILASLQPVGTETVSLAEGLDRVLALPLAAYRSQPPKDMSAMDGYAVRAEDVATTPVELEVIAEVAAGASYDQVVPKGRCVRIFTGAPLPAGTDTIIIQENTEADESGGTVRILERAAKGTYVRPAGLDFKTDDVVFDSGHRMNSRSIGLAAAMNRPWLTVYRRPRVAILATGDEIVLPGEPLGENQIVSSNGPALAAAVVKAGGVPTLLPVAKDDPEALRAVAKGAAGHDLVLTTGGASVGKHDLIGSALTESGLELDFWKIAMRPGKPLMFGHLSGVPMLGLPGNPVSALVCFLLFGVPALSKLLGMGDTAPRLDAAILDAPLPENDRREDYLRADLLRDSAGNLHARPYSRQDSSMMRRLATAGCLIRRLPHAAPAQIGDTVEIIDLSSF